METHLGTLPTISCGRRNESRDGYILDADECGGQWLEENVVCEACVICAEHATFLAFTRKTDDIF